MGDYDTLMTRRYKTARAANLAYSMVVSDGQQLVSLIDYIAAYRSRGVRLSQIQGELQRNGTSVDSDTLLVAVYNSYGGRAPTDDEKEAIMLEMGELPDGRAMQQLSDVDLYYQPAVTVSNAEIPRDAARGLEIATIQQRLVDSWRLPGHFLRGVTKLHSASYSYHPTKTATGTPPTTTDGLHIFNEAIVSIYMPYIQYTNGHGDNLYKIYRGTEREHEPNYDYITLGRSRRPKPHSLHMTLWLGDPDGTRPDLFYGDVKDTFHAASYDLVTGEAKVKVPSEIRWSSVDVRDLATRRLEGGLLLLSLGESSVVGIKAEVPIVPVYSPYPTSDVGRLSRPRDQEQVTILNHIMLHLALVEPTYSRYLYVEESARPYPFKKRLSMHYRPAYSELKGDLETRGKQKHYSTVTFSPQTTVAPTEQVLPLFVGGELRETKLDIGYSYIRLAITDATSVREIDDFVNIMMPLMNIYQWGSIGGVTRELLIRNYNLLVPGTTSLVQLEGMVVPPSPTEEVTEVRSRSGERMAELASSFPQVFGGNFARLCQSEAQPITLRTQEEADAWELQTYTKGGISYNRKTIIFPAPGRETLFWVGCPSNTNPIPSIIENKTGYAQDVFPYLPCCNEGERKNDLYKMWYQGQEPTQKNRDTRLKTGALLESGRVGALPLTIESTLRRYGVDGEFNHQGVDRSASSLLHAVLLAIDEEGYRMRVNYGTSTDREAYVTYVRGWIADRTRPELLRQEIYDATDDEILTDLRNPTVHLDPTIYYRALEDVFQVNIFCFIPKSTQQTGGDLEIPRHRYFHLRPQRLGRPTVLIYKYYGSEFDNLIHPQCDLIMVRNYTMKADLRLFGSSMTDLCMSILGQAQGVVTWYPPTCPLTSTVPNLTVADTCSGLSISTTTASETCQDTKMKVYDNLYSVIDYESILGNSIVSQYVDANGKVRAFTFHYSGVQVSVVVPPAQPLNVPHSGHLVPVSAETARTLIGRPTAAVHDGTTTVGLWFPLLGIEHGLYVRVRSDEPQPGWASSLPVGPVEPLTVGTRSITDRITKLRKTLSILTQLLRWVFDIWRLRSNRRPGEERRDSWDDYLHFANTYITTDTYSSSNPRLDSVNYYRLDELPSVLPTLHELGVTARSHQPQQSSEILAALEHINRHAPTLVSAGGQFVMYNATFRDNMVGDLERYLKVTYDAPLSLQEEILSSHATESDFKSGPGVEVFVDTEDLTKWLEDKARPTDVLHIRKVLNLSMATALEPYLFQTEDHKIYLIQNPADGRIETAAGIGIAWNAGHYNPGPYTEGVSNMPNHIIYGIRPDGHLTVLTDNSGGTAVYLRILSYMTNDDRVKKQQARHGAMLEMI